MRIRPNSVLRFALPIKVLLQRFTFVLLVGAAVALMMIGKVDVVMVERARMAIADAATPLLEAIAEPMATIEDFAGRLRELAVLRAENSRLREENERLRQWQATAMRLESENRSLAGLLNFEVAAPARTIAARVIGESAGAFVRGVLIRAGSREGVIKGQVVAAGEGLVGRVTEVGNRSARVLLITDLNSRIPVTVQGSGERAILAGDNSDRPRLLYMQANAAIQPGDRIVTSGHGGGLPPGLPVGVVVEAEDGGLAVDTFVNFARIDHIRVIDYGLGETLPTPQPTRRRGERR